MITLSSILVTLLLASTTVIVVSGPNDNHHDHYHRHQGEQPEIEIKKKCGTESPNSAMAALDNARVNLLKEKKKKKKKQQQPQQQHGDDEERRVQAESCEDLCKQCIEIEVYVHFMQFAGEDFGLDFDFIPHPRESVKQLLDFNDTSLTADDFTSVDDMLLIVKEQMKMMNEYFADTPFFFTQMEPDSPSITVNTEWARYAEDMAYNMSVALNRGTLRTLNLYLGWGVDSLEGAQAGFTIVAFARFPAWQLEGISDGIYQRYDTLPGAGFPFNDIGMTTVHETGHWLGLYHTFENSMPESDPCSPLNPGDRIADTPQQASDTQSIVRDCTIFLGPDPAPFPDSCPELPGLDPVFNFMNYVNDEACQVDNGEFTCEQVERMSWQWQLYRDGEPVCDDGEMEFGVVIQFESKPEGQAWVDNFFLVSANGQVIFNSTIDYDSTFTAYGAPIAVIICIQNDDYAFIYNDGEGDGFALDENAFIEVYQDGEQIARITGDFGPQVIVEISQVSVDTPTIAPVAPPTSSTLPPISPPPVSSPTKPPRKPIPPGKGKGKGYYSPTKGKGKGKGGGVYYYYHSHGPHGRGHYHPAHGGGGIFVQPMKQRYGYYYYGGPRSGSMKSSSMMKSHHGSGRGMGGRGYYQRPPREHRYYGPPRTGWW